MISRPWTKTSLEGKGRKKIKFMNVLAIWIKWVVHRCVIGLRRRREPATKSLLFGEGEDERGEVDWEQKQRKPRNGVWILVSAFLASSRKVLVLLIVALVIACDRVFAIITNTNLINWGHILQPAKFHKLPQKRKNYLIFISTKYKLIKGLFSCVKSYFYPLESNESSLNRLRPIYQNINNISYYRGNFKK